MFSQHKPYHVWTRVWSCPDTCAGRLCARRAFAFDLFGARPRRAQPKIDILPQGYVPPTQRDIIDLTQDSTGADEAAPPSARRGLDFGAAEGAGAAAGVLVPPPARPLPRPAPAAAGITAPAANAPRYQPSMQPEILAEPEPRVLGLGSWV